MKTSAEVLQAVGSLIQGNIAGNVDSPFTEAAVNGQQVRVAVRDEDGETRYFGIMASQIEGPVLPADMQPAQEGSGVAADDGGDAEPEAGEEAEGPAATAAADA